MPLKTSYFVFVLLFQLSLCFLETRIELYCTCQKGVHTVQSENYEGTPLQMLVDCDKEKILSSVPMEEKNDILVGK